MAEIDVQAQNGGVSIDEPDEKVNNASSINEPEGKVHNEIRSSRADSAWVNHLVYPF